jgi:hypothetical protein
MGYDLSGEASYFRFSIREWPVCLKLAKAFGWEPLGTIDPLNHTSPELWSGNDYTSNAWQLVTMEDAKQMASALRRAIKATEVDDPDPSSEQRAVLGQIADGHGILVFRDFGDFERSVYAALSGSGSVSLSRLREFIEFCEAGPFRIG